ncbi:hypothetical protein [Devosia lacusdianchii]|uniref:hypothetical protein n=1 Tax=Devosia lacusdianchii TaxID=2917991 RepID=UPI001F068D7E|nr:hypothetical protein [Devosia sp. JXJ CY 41]
MHHHIKWLLLAGLLSSSSPATAFDLLLAGEWISDDRKTVVEMSACPSNERATCATILADQPEAGEPSLAGKMVGVDFVQRSDGTWEGAVLAASGARLPATLSMPHPERLDMKVCAAVVFCDSVSYLRR